MPRHKTPKLGKTIKGEINFIGRKMAAKNRQAFTMVPTSHWGWPKEKGIKKDAKDRPIKSKIGMGADKLTGKLNDKVLWNIIFLS